MSVRRPVTATAIVAALFFTAGETILPAHADVPPKEPVRMQDQEAVQGIAWVQVPQGSARIGEVPSRETRTLAHPLTVSAAPITNRQYARFLNATGRAAPVFPMDSPYIRFIRDLAPQFTWRRQAASRAWLPPLGRGAYPVAFVTLADAKAYCAWLSTQTGRSYRLPHRAELEYCLALRPRSERDFGVYPQRYGPRWRGNFVAWYGLSAVTIPGPVTAQEKDWGKPLSSRFNLRYYPQALTEWTDDGVAGSGWSSAQASQTHLFPMHGIGIELNVYGLRVVATPH